MTVQIPLKLAQRGGALRLDRVRIVLSEINLTWEILKNGAICERWEPAFLGSIVQSLAADV